MDWIFDHLQILVVVAIVVTGLLQNLKKAATRQQAREIIDADEAERTRRVQEEIRRRIAARRSGAAPAQPVAPVMMNRDLPVAPPVVAPRPVASSPNIFEELSRRLAEAKRAAAAVRTREIRDAAERQRAPAARPAAAAPSAMAEPVVTGVPEIFPGLESSGANVDAELFSDLRGAAGLRRAFLLREILGPPVGLR